MSSNKNNQQKDIKQAINQEKIVDNVDNDYYDNEDYSDTDYDDWEPDLRKRKGNGGFQFYGSSKHIRNATAKFR